MIDMTASLYNAFKIQREQPNIQTGLLVGYSTQISIAVIQEVNNSSSAKHNRFCYFQLRKRVLSSIFNTRTIPIIVPPVYSGEVATTQWRW